MVHTAIGFALANLRLAALAYTSSIGSGATNMTTVAAEGTINRLPVLLLPSDYYVTRHQRPMLQQLEHHQRRASLLGGDVPGSAGRTPALPARLPGGAARGRLLTHCASLILDVSRQSAFSNRSTAASSALSNWAPSPSSAFRRTFPARASAFTGFPGGAATWR